MRAWLRPRKQHEPSQVGLEYNMTMITDKICEQCGNLIKPFWPESTRKRRFCGRKCWIESLKNIPIYRECKRCGQIVKPNYNGKVGIFCNQECYFGHKLTELITDKKCQVCEKLIKPFRLNESTKDRKFCSLKCKRKGKGLNVSKECQICGGKRLPLHSKKGYCSSKICLSCRKSLGSLRSFNRQPVRLSLKNQKHRDLILSYRISQQAEREVKKNESKGHPKRGKI